MNLPPRNISARISAVIKKQAAANFHHAVWVSIAAGPPLSHGVTINVTNTGLAPAKTSSAFSKLRSRRFAPWLREEQKARKMHPSPPTYAWAIEAPSRRNFAGTKSSDVHIHWMLYIPPGLIRPFFKKLNVWIDELFNGILNRRYAVRRKLITNPIGEKRYMSKGMSSSVAKRAGVRVSPQGTVTGRRSGYSENLGPTVRKTDPAVVLAIAAAKAALGPAHKAGDPDMAGVGRRAGRKAYRAARGQRRF